ncbi:unnamed protein product [Clonostachys byssicola]|uniref:Uncharacterized protein n=1 Tax=Clonostachys byssicola TaxID=160290 RepID=A0A9N9U5K5_9HYPO|nr:unnamed protein product [Clonostachys byssicola]
MSQEDREVAEIVEAARIWNYEATKRAQKELESKYVPILAKTAKVFPLTISQGIVFPSLPLVLQGISVVGSPLAPVGSQRQMLEFAALHGIKPQIEKFPLTQTGQTGITNAMQRLRDGKMRYRGVVVVP